jgi:hypothetical protein
VVQPDERYTLRLDGWGQMAMPAGGLSVVPSFTSLGGETLAAYHMTFRVSSAAPIQTIPDALSADPETVLADVYRPARRAQASTPAP